MPRAGVGVGVSRRRAVSVEPPVPGDWILATGDWEDTGVWDDSANWID